MILGKQIVIHPNYNDEGIKAMAIDIDDDGGLVVNYLQGPKNGMTYNPANPLLTMGMKKSIS